MKNLKTKIKEVVCLMILTVFSLAAYPQGNAVQGTSGKDGTSKSSGYFQNIEKNATGVPNSSAWYAQPWVWAILAAILILIAGLLYKSYGKRDEKSEAGL